VQRVGAHLRFSSSLPARLNELAIKAGLPESLADDLAQGKRTLGEQGVVDLIGVSGYYTLVSMVLHVAEIPLPAGVPSPW
jgi:4-carboxymuconolactone decarboxylase